MHGIERARKSPGPPAQDQGLRQVIVRYSDGRELIFVPDAGREVFNEDDLLELKRILTHASSVVEWSEL